MAKTSSTRSSSEAFWIGAWAGVLLLLGVVYIKVAVSMNIVPAAIVLALLVVGMIYFTRPRITNKSLTRILSKKE